MEDEILQYIKETKIDNRLNKPFDKHYSEHFNTYCKITFFTLKELQELHYFNIKHKPYYNGYFFGTLRRFFINNKQYETSTEDLLFVVNCYGIVYYSVSLFYF